MTRLLVSLVLLLTLPAHAADPPDPGELLGKTAPLGLVEAIQLALHNNLGLTISRTAPEVAHEQLEQARGVFDPIGFAEYRFEHSEIPIANAVQSAFGGGANIDTDEWNYSGGFNGILPVGMSYGSTYNFRRTDTDSAFTGLEPENRASVTSELVLPLLRDLIHNEANVTVKRSRIAEAISQDEFRRDLTDFVLLVESSYWELAASGAGVEVAQKSLKTANDLLEQTRIRHEVGVVSRVDVTQAEAGVAEREFAAITAGNRAGRAQDTLLNLVVVPSHAGFATTHLVPEEPTYVEYTVNEEVSVARAMRHRPELAAARRTVEDAELQLAFAENQRLPRLDLVASYTVNGLSGTQKRNAGTLPPRASSCVDANLDGVCDAAPVLDTCSVDPLTGQCSRVSDLGLSSGGSSSHSDFFRGSGDKGWVIGGRVEIPFGNRSARHLAFQREIELRRTRTALRRTEQTVILDVRNSSRVLRNALQALQAAERRVVAQEETLRAEQERLRLGDSTPFTVLEFEEDLAEAEQQEIFALQTYRNAIAALERAQGTLLETRNISVEQELGRQPL